MSKRHLALRIPHICDDIVRHLSNKDVLSCKTVSKNFYEAFAPYSWHTISISERGKYQYLRTDILASESQLLIEIQPRIQFLSSVYGEVWDLFVKRADVSSNESSDITDALIPQYIPRASFTNLTVLHARSNPDEVGCSINNPKYIHQLLAVIEHSPRLRELKLIDHCSLDDMQLTQLAGIIRGHPSLKDLTIKANEIRSSIYRKLLWALWNLERVAIKATIATHNEADKSDEVRKSEEAERELDAWIADNRPKRSTPTTKEHRIGDEPRLLFTLKEFHIHTGYHDMDFGMSFQFLRRCPDLKRFRPPRIDSEDLLQSIMAAIPETWPNLEHLDMGNFSPNRSSGDEHDAWLLAACSSSMRHTGGVKSIVLAPARFSRLQTAQTIYIRYAYTLVDLNLIGCSSFEGHLLQKVLTTCHKLQSLVALTETLNHPPPFMWKIGNVKDDPILESANLEYAANWVCLGLKTLRIQFCSMDMSCGEYRSNRAGIPKALIWQIERLMNLRDLRLCLDPPTWKDSGFKEGDPELRWWFDTVKVWGRENLQSALTVFGGLWHLRTLELRNLRDYIDISSLEDAKSSWENLKWVHYS